MGLLGLIATFEHSCLKPFILIGIILLIFKSEGNILGGKDWLNRIASCSNMSLFISFRILIGILFGLSLLSRFKEKMVLKTSQLSFEVIKNDSLLSGGSY